MILVVVAAVIVVLLFIRLSLAPLRRLRMAFELRGEWWPRFESEFRAYASNHLQGRDAEPGG
jgi:hypothetical protein